MTKLHLLGLACCILLTACKKEEEIEVEPAPKDNSNNLNISILLDLSDRIDPEKYANPAMDYYQRDAGYINSVAEAFTSHVRSKKIMQVNDKMQLFFDPAPLNNEINNISKNLKVSLTRDNISREKMADIKNVFSTEPLKIYKLAINDKKYVGSDTWKFFKNKVRDYCIEPDKRNILIILTDGYIFYKDSRIREKNRTTWLTPEWIRENGLISSAWRDKLEKGDFGFIPATSNLSNLEILVLGINPDPKNPYEEDVIKAYWSKWFDSMEVKTYDIKNAELPADMDKVIREFITRK